MFSLKKRHLIASAMLVWFALFLSTAFASSFIQSSGLQPLCSTGGLIKWVDGDDDGTPKFTGGMDCPLCSTVHAPPSPIADFDAPAPHRTHVLHPVTAALIAAATAPPLPSRGPPTALFLISRAQTV
jgi:hypothetical protein